MSDRKYDPETGRFPSPDRLWEKFTNVSPYNYCANNPVRFTDPTGMQAPGADGVEGEGEETIAKEAEGAVTEEVTNPRRAVNTNTRVGPEGETEFIEPELTGPPTNVRAFKPENPSMVEIRNEMERNSSGITEPPPQDVYGIQSLVDAMAPEPSRGSETDEEPGEPPGAPLGSGSVGESGVRATAPVEKFSDYIFKEGAEHGKEAVFESLGYSRENSAELARTWESQAAAKYSQGEYTLGRLDQYGQRINITIELSGIGSAAGKTSFIQSGWMIRPDGSITLNTPFSGFAK